MAVNKSGVAIPIVGVLTACLQRFQVKRPQTPGQKKLHQQERQNQNAATFNAPAMVGQSVNAQFAPNQAFAGLFPNIQSTTSPYFTNPLGGIFSGAVAGGALGKAFG